VSLKNLTKQENRHPESPLWGEGSALISPAHRAAHILAPDFCLLTSFKNDKTNPIQKSITRYAKRSNPKNHKIKTNPNEPICG
jgi:hypothetical protein